MLLNNNYIVSVIKSYSILSIDEQRTDYANCDITRNRLETATALSAIGFYEQTDRQTDGAKTVAMLPSGKERHAHTEKMP